MTDDLYNELILEHAKKSRHLGTLAGSAWSTELNNPLCGDKISLYIQSDGEKLTEIKFSGDGCAISQAAASMFIELAAGQSEGRVVELLAKYKSLIRDTNHGLAEEEAVLGELTVLRGVSKFPARHRCALLICEGFEKYLSQLAKAQAK